MSNKHLHIVSFNVPFPANYGGVIDVFYKIVQLHSAGIKIHLHCFSYGREESTELNKYCEEIHYYPRRDGALYALHYQPYIVVTRSSEALISRLLKDNHPILLEGLHCCHLLTDQRLNGRMTIFRESNVEHIYYYHLFKSEKNWSKKLFFLSESIKLKYFEKNIKNASLMLTVSQSDTDYFRGHYPQSEVHYLPSFHPNNEVQSLIGRGTYVLYHGNLAVAENHLAAMHLLQQVVPKSNQQFIFAGLDPSAELIKEAALHANVKLIPNPEESEMKRLIQNAHVHVLITFQATGLKLKLLNVLYAGRFCLVNDEMLSGTGLAALCEIGNSVNELQKKLDVIFQSNFTQAMIDERKQVLSEHYSNRENAKKLIELCWKN